MKSVMVDEKDEVSLLNKGRVDVLGLLDKYESQNVMLNKRCGEIMALNAELEDVNKAHQLIIT